MPCRLPIVVVLSLVLTLIACAESAKQPRYAPISGSPNAQPINGNLLTLVQAGMTKGQVRNLVGPPSGQNSYWTWLSWLPGSDNDARRTSWHYEGRGEVVFAEKRFSGAPATVFRIDVEQPRPGVIR